MTKVCPTPVITRKLRALKGPQVRTITRYGTGSVVLFNCAERNSLVKQSEQSPTDIISTGDYSLRFVREFRTDRLTRHVPLSVRFVLRNDSKNWNRSSVCQHVYSYQKNVEMLSTTSQHFFSSHGNLFKIFRLLCRHKTN